MNTYRIVLALCCIVASFPHSILLAKSPFSARTQKVIKVEYLDTCDQRVYPVTFKYAFLRNGSDLVINGEAIVTRDIKSPVKHQYRIEKCKDKSNPDTCEYYTTWKWDDMCTSLKLPFIKVFVDAFTPPISCPFKKNRYYLKNMRLSADVIGAFLAYSNSNVLWKFRMKLLEDASTTVACTDFGFRIVSIRVRT